MQKMKEVVFLLAAVLPAVLCGEDLASSYSYSTVLFDRNQDRYELYWSFDRAAETIDFAVNVSTTGWVGFGLSPNGGMPGSDVVIGWVDGNQRAFLNDRYADAKEQPPIDESQDWELLSGREEDGYTILQFRRDWVTCDDRDRNIDSQTARLVFSWNDADPENNDPNNAMYHGPDQRDTLSVNLLGALEETPADPDDLQSFAFTVNNVEVSTSETTYWCEVFELPEEIRNQTRYITKFSPAITENSFSYVHHMLVYACSEELDESFVGVSAPCFLPQFPPAAEECLQNQLIAVWAVGGDTFYYPENVAYPIGGAGSPRHYVVEIHYDNPKGDTGVHDSSGMEFFYTSSPREFDAGILYLGDQVGINEVVPPNAVDYQIFGWCPSDCTDKYFPEGGIKIFANMLHTHLVGHGLILHHFRENDTCGGYEELKPIDLNLQYNFNYQQVTVLPQEVTVLAGDALLLECRYSTEGVRTGVTLGGTSTREEMCLTFAVYYPRTPLTVCESVVTPEAYTPFVSGLSPQLQFQIVQASTLFDAEGLKAALDQLEWTPEQIAELQDAVSQGPFYVECVDDKGGSEEIERLMRLNITCAYQEPDVCGNRTTVEVGGNITCAYQEPDVCGNRTTVEVGGASPSTPLTTVLIPLGLIASLAAYWTV